MGEKLGDLTYYLLQFDFEILYHPGKNNLDASRLNRNIFKEPQGNYYDKLKVVNLVNLEIF